MGLGEEVLETFVEEEREREILKNVAFWGLGLNIEEFQLGLRAEILLFAVEVKEGQYRTEEEARLLPSRPGIRMPCVVIVLAAFLFSTGFSLSLQHLPRQLFLDCLLSWSWAPRLDDISIRWYENGLSYEIRNHSLIKEEQVDRINRDSMMLVMEVKMSVVKLLYL